MAKYTGGMQVSGGYYWNPGNWEVEVVSPEGGRLKGPEGAKYAKVPFLALFAIVPLLGALFLMFLPLIGFALFAIRHREEGHGQRDAGRDRARLHHPAWPVRRG